MSKNNDCKTSTFLYYCFKMFHINCSVSNKQDIGNEGTEYICDLHNITVVRYQNQVSGSCMCIFYLIIPLESQFCKRYSNYWSLISKFKVIICFKASNWKKNFITVIFKKLTRIQQLLRVLHAQFSQFTLLIGSIIRNFWSALRSLCILDQDGWMIHFYFNYPFERSYFFLFVITTLENK